MFLEFRSKKPWISRNFLFKMEDVGGEATLASQCQFVWTIPSLSRQRSVVTCSRPNWKYYIGYTVAASNFGSWGSRCLIVLSRFRAPVQDEVCLCLLRGWAQWCAHQPLHCIHCCHVWRSNLQLCQGGWNSTNTGWWFGTFFIFPYVGNHHPNWLIFFRGVETTNQNNIQLWCTIICKFKPRLRPIRFSSMLLPFHQSQLIGCYVLQYRWSEFSSMRKVSPRVLRQEIRRAFGCNESQVRCQYVLDSVLMGRS